MNYDAIIWDWNGTLLDDIDLCIEIANDLLVSLELPELTLDRYRDIFDFPVSLYWQRAGLDLDTVDFPALSEEFCGRFESRIDETSLFPHVLPVIDELTRHGIRQFILSATEHTSLLDMLQKKDIHHHFHDVQGMEDTLARGKQSGGHKLMAKHGLDPARTLLVGDTTHDLEVAEALGANCVLISTGHHSHERLTDKHHNVFESLGHLLDHMKQTLP